MQTVATKKDMQTVLDEHYSGAHGSMGSIDADVIPPRISKKASIFKAFISGPATSESPVSDRKNVSQSMHCYLNNVSSSTIAREDLSDTV